MNLKRSIVYISLLGLFFSCSQDEVEPSTLTLLTDNARKSWRLVELYNNGEVDNTSCERDDIWTFQLFDDSQNGQPSFQVEDNYISCGDSDGYFETGIWRLNNERNRINLTNSISGQLSSGAIENAVYEIIEVTDSKLVLRNFREEGIYGLRTTNIELHFINY